MGKTIALSREAYDELKKLKEELGLSYNELIILLVREYRKKRKEELKELCNKLKLSENEVKRIEEIIKELRERRWW